MRFIGVAFVFALLLHCPLLDPREKAIDITPNYIAGIPLGMSKPVALKLITKPLRHDLLEDGYERYVSPRQKVEVYFSKGTRRCRGRYHLESAAPDRRADRAVHNDRSAEAGLPRPAEGVPRGSRHPAYRLGNLVFTVNGKRVGAVGLGRGDGGAYVTLNVAPCR